LIAEGNTKLASVPSGGGGAGGGAGGAAAGGAAAEAPKEEAKEEGMVAISSQTNVMSLTNFDAEKEESDEDMGFGLFD
jgi:large subunit ribosomal protein LP2